MAFKKKFYMARFNKEESKDINEEFEIPAHLPEIKKILMCRERVMPPQIYEEDEKRICGGSIRFSIIYVGADGRLYSLPAESEYSFSFPIAEDTIGDVADAVSVSSEGMNARAQSPARVSVKGRIKAVYVMQSTAKDSECIVEKAVPAACEALCKSVGYSCIEGSEPEIFEIVDEMVNDMGSDSPRIIYCESNALVSDVDGNGERITVRGEVNTEILWCDDTFDEIPRVIRRKTPFSYTSSEKILSGREHICANAVCISTQPEIEDNGILIKISCAVKFIGALKDSESICTDIYSPTNKITVSNNDFETYVPYACANKNMSINSAVSASEAKVSQLDRVVYCTAFATADKMLYGDDVGREAIGGRAVFKIITANDSGEDIEYDCKEITLPFKYDVSRDVADGGISSAPILLASVLPTRTLARFDGERVGLDTELSISFFILGKMKKTCISSVTLGERKQTDTDVVRIVYPTKGETLWQLSKRTDSRIDPLASKNGITADDKKDSPESLSSVKYVIL